MPAKAGTVLHPGEHTHTHCCACRVLRQESQFSTAAWSPEKEHLSTGHQGASGHRSEIFRALPPHCAVTRLHRGRYPHGCGRLPGGAESPRDDTGSPRGDLTCGVLSPRSGQCTCWSLCSKTPVCFPPRNSCQKRHGEPEHC